MGQAAIVGCRCRRWLSTTLIASVGTIAVVFAQDASEKSKNIELENQRKTVSLLEEEWLNALNSANVDTIARILADDFVRPAPDSGHFVTKADLLPYYQSHLAPKNSIQRRIEDLTVTLYGSTALARGVVTTTDSERHVIQKLLFTDVFVQRSGKWEAVSAQENPITTPLIPNH